MKHLIESMSPTEKQKIISSYFQNGQIKQIPSKEKRKLVLIEHIAEDYFKKDRIYLEQEVNEILKGIYGDYAYLRRCLVDYKFMERSKDCREYWLR